MCFGDVMWLDEWMHYSGGVIWFSGVYCWDEHVLLEV